MKSASVLACSWEDRVRRLHVPQRPQRGRQLAHAEARPEGSGHDFFTRGEQRGNGGHRGRLCLQAGSGRSGALLAGAR